MWIDVDRCELDVKEALLSRQHHSDVRPDPCLCNTVLLMCIVLGELERAHASTRHISEHPRLSPTFVLPFQLTLNLRNLAYDRRGLRLSPRSSSSVIPPAYLPLQSYPLRLPSTPSDSQRTPDLSASVSHFQLINIAPGLHPRSWCRRQLVHA